MGTDMMMVTMMLVTAVIVAMVVMIFVVMMVVLVVDLPAAAQRSARDVHNTSHIGH